MLIHLSPPVRNGSGLLLATGQLTSYGSGTGVDDGALRKGLSKIYTILTLGQYAGVTNILVNGKTDVHSNNCVVDNRTKLMWSRYASASVGPASDGKLPWTTTGSGGTAEGIFPYCAAANAAALAGHNDWRVASVAEWFSILDYEAPTAVPNITAFPTLTNSWTSTTLPSSTTAAFASSLTSGTLGTGGAKTTTFTVLLVRG